MKYLYLHELGQKPDSWDRVIKETKVSDRSASLSLAEMLEGKAATYKELYTAFSEECNKENDEIILCGLSLGAVLALNYAIDHPNKVKALVLIAAKEAEFALRNAKLSFYGELVRQSIETVFSPEEIIALYENDDLAGGAWTVWNDIGCPVDKILIIIAKLSINETIQKAVADLLM